MCRYTLRTPYRYRGLLSFILLAAVCAIPMGFAQELNSDQVKERRKAVTELAKQGASALPQLAPVLQDVDRSVRQEAVKAIAEIGTQASIPLLIQATQDNDAEVQVLAVDGLVNIYLPGYFQTGVSAVWNNFTRSIKSRFTEVSDRVVDPYVHARPEVIEAIAKLIKSGMSMESRANAARGVGILRGKLAIPELLAGLKTRDDKVIYESLNALQKIGDPEVASQIAYLLSDPDKKIQLAAIETTGMLRNENALPSLENLLARSRDKDVRRAALEAIAMLARPRSRETFLTYLNDKDENMRAGAAEGLGRLGSRDDVAMLREKFNEETKRSPRLSLAFALVATGDNSTETFSPLTYLVNETNKSAYRSVAQAFLTELARNQDVRGALYRFLEGGTRDERIALCNVMARSGGADSVPYLERLSQDRDVEVGKEALRALQVLRSRIAG
ncbi:MAG: HEAT repeat domain-containing protein [Bryobacterales bacterium]|nr:HEAT repeat domain-containing protein [Bryobacterales bacterium]